MPPPNDLLPPLQTFSLAQLQQYVYRIKQSLTFGTITSVTAGTGLTGGGSTGGVTLAIADTAITPGTYSNATVTFNQQGQATRAVSGNIFTQTQPITINNTAAETTLLGTGVGSLTLPANFFTVGKSIKLTAFGFHSASGNPTIRIRLYLGATVVLDTTAVTSGNSTDAIWEMRGLMTCASTGNTGSLNAQGFYEEEAGGFNLFGMVNTAPVTIDTTGTLVLNLTAQWGTGALGNTITMTNLLVEVG